MHYYYITGTSRGIGKALAEQLLSRQNTYVIGLSRTATIEHERYEHITLNLNQVKSVDAQQFIALPDALSITLVNNAGTLGDTKHVGNISPQAIADTYVVNSIAPSLLMNSFVSSYQHTNCKRSIINISSGAGRHTIESWASYCASKAALDMFSEVAQEEQYKVTQQQPIRIFSVAPGIVDTQMQDEIRTTLPEDFSEVNRFIAYKKDGALTPPEEVAQQLLKIIDTPEKFKEVKLDVRKL